MYEATVTAKNRYGTSEMSEAFQFYTLGPGKCTKSFNLFQANRIINEINAEESIALIMLTS